ncbi:hypothetical protein GE21DRAFT_4324 [Neurospora crassa]|uniref:Pyruvate dehydrogenase X component n=2 Tax=Neurospora crassa TaxID=5141 RepID=Q7RWS2_NEUCR|nr:pyruvate dehydrogenase X component [Neurospora crassa OR74A]8OHS_C Chain C, Pyruvate dehydrogenase X component [Neurospora crassa]8OHS_E Chain E, Pyruvate dehydrogenase X component [Neurospora crassa]8OHS_H Chain H, Pyruvate dehydrogenase X component [Neurospora crassa]EAA26925.2 pyruvate dehydrogenase X component [Neurospora crassa OR74A]KHE79572.1 hypothetical protein GE21DRAFT_4324 [Neurospora crassa]|eukprot:XP_956161.2 pyruvate dehydrogenase X component [Neurospora crassa OR74A]
MASLTAACRISARMAGRSVRGFRTSAAALAAQNFTMPALSPTMTEGNIATWRVKEGDKFSAGDVLLEIETDKATMDVEAQDDGVMVKIMKNDGAKGVAVGARIAVIAEEGDDISSLEIPADAAPQSKPAESAPSAPPPPTTADQSNVAVPESAPQNASSKSAPKPPKRQYPHYPSVAHLLKVNGIDAAAVKDITPTGPGGRLLKGDVLAYLGKINAQTPSTVSERFEKQSHLDLSNIKVAKSTEAVKATTEKAQSKKLDAPAPPPVAVVTAPISLSAAIDVQNKLHKTIGVFLPLSTFITRATEIANQKLPLPANYQPTADELFNQVLGLDKVTRKESRGSYTPTFGSFVAPQRAARKADIIDILAAPSTRVAASAQSKSAAPGLTTSGPNVFSLQVPKSEEKRAQAFLQKMKLVLEQEPDKLVRA